MTGASTASAACITASICSMLVTLKAGTPYWCSAAWSRSWRSVIRDIGRWAFLVIGRRENATAGWGSEAGEFRVDKPQPLLLGGLDLAGRPQKHHFGVQPLQQIVLAAPNADAHRRLADGEFA